MRPLRQIVDRLSEELYDDRTYSGNRSTDVQKITERIFTTMEERLHQWEVKGAGQ